ncbi:MAG: hypothetical protein ACFCUQ_21865 [Kiloniellales bacterium]
MKGAQAVHALIRKRSELEGEIVATKAKLRRLVANLAYLDGTLKLFAPDIEPSAILPKLAPAPYAAKKGQTTRIILAALREAPDGLTCAELAQIIMAKRGIKPSKATGAVMRKRVRACLKAQRNRGLLQSRPGPGKLLVWEIAG